MNNYKWTISKEFSWEMGHRVWSQKLEHERLSVSTECACKHLHGHSYITKVFLEAKELDYSGMVTDFKNLNFVKVFLDTTLDHKFMIDINDPLFENITRERAKSFGKVNNFTNLVNLVEPEVVQDDFYKSFVLVNFVPTSENICKSFKEHFQLILGPVATISAVELWETRKSHCRYE